MQVPEFLHDVVDGVSIVSQRGILRSIRRPTAD